MSRFYIETFSSGDPLDWSVRPLSRLHEDNRATVMSFPNEDKAKRALMEAMHTEIGRLAQAADRLRAELAQEQS